MTETDRPWTPFTIEEKTGRVTSRLPPDESIVEVLLTDGTVERAFYTHSLYEPGDFEFAPVDENDEPCDLESFVSRLVAWRPTS